MLVTIVVMPARSTVLTESGNLVHRSLPNTIYPILFGMLSAMHASIAGPAFIYGRWEGYLSLIFCLFFLAAAVVCRVFRFEIATLKNERQVRIRHGIGRFYFERLVPFSAITHVRLTLLGGKSPESSQIELLSRNDDIRYPPAEHPRQEALLLAMTLNVPLVKVYGENVLPDRDRVHETVE